MRNGFWTGLLTGALLGAGLVMVISPEARSQFAEMTGDMNMRPMGRRIGQAARRLADRTGMEEALEDLT